MARRFTVQQYVAALKGFPGQANRLIKAELTADMHRLAAYTRRTKFRRGGRLHTGWVVSRTGRLEQSVRPLPTRVSRGIVRAGIRMGGSQARYAPFVEFGTRPHVIVPRRARVLRFTTERGDVVFTKRVNHPGSRARHPIERSVREWQRGHFRTMANAFISRMRRIFG